MEILEQLPQILPSITTPWMLFLMLGGVAFGTILGAIPGLTGGTGIALMLPVTYYMDPLSSLVFLSSIYTGGNYGGAITAILINAPGSPASAATVFDGYPMMQKGQVGRALGLAVGASALGSLIGSLVLLFAIGPLGTLALSFGPPEMFMIAIFGLTIIASLQGANVAKGYLAGLLGLLLGMVGMSTTGAMRGTFGNYQLLDGVPLIPALIGLFCFSELLVLLDQSYLSKTTRLSREQIGEMFRGMREVLRHPWNIIRSAAIGVGVGALPGAGATVASLVSYNAAKHSSRNPSRFGTGIPEGIIASESANNSSEGGATATMLVLGVPGGAATAVMLGAIILQGWVPGPRMVYEHQDVVYAYIVANALQDFLLLPVGFVLSYAFSKVVNIPVRYLVPVLGVLTVAGTYAGRNSLVDPVVMVAFGVLGWLLRRYDYPVIAVILGIILGPLADAELIRTMQRFGGDLTVFVTRPISLILLLASVGALVGSHVMTRKARARVETESAASG
ncbi:tripartite tricarboxylate transporter permease [Limnochorda pilosa]|uniref:DUF112 domain-containing protein n=1 Tax=Limnochorda pilosa TaxID=1555112 RepID=A0A0K2SMH3_LIMPI|nr:tripartite tricarboxylate transporter permease [Limnochorda pilosa]BAS28029.1 hypothetical protein LIP_2188 [Limnochorda pilosa]